MGCGRRSGYRKALAVLRAGGVALLVAGSTAIAQTSAPADEHQGTPRQAGEHRDGQGRGRIQGEADDVAIQSSYNFKRIHQRITTSGVVGDKRLAELAAQGYQTLINLLPDSNEYAVEEEAGIVTAQGIDYI